MNKEEIINIPVRIGSDLGHVAVRKWAVHNPRGQVICLHGLGVTGAEFAVLAHQMNRMNLDVLCPDWIGHGESTYFGSAKSYQSFWYVQTLVQVLAQLYIPGQTHLLASSFGAIIGFVYVTASKLAFRSAGFIDMPLTQNDESSEYRNILSKIIGHRFATYDEAQRQLREIRPSLFSYPAEYESYYREVRFHSQNGAVMVRCDEAVLAGSGLDSNVPYDLRPQITRLPCPAYFIYGRRSPFPAPALFKQYTETSSGIFYRDDLDADHPPCLFTSEQISAVTDYIALFDKNEGHGSDKI